jgi:lysophospholipase L1-like esterase
MLQDDGKINPKYFVSDGLHPSQAGYQVLARAIRPALVQK